MIHLWVRSACFTHTHTPGAAFLCEWRMAAAAFEAPPPQFSWGPAPGLHLGPWCAAPSGREESSQQAAQTHYYDYGYDYSLLLLRSLPRIP